MSPSEAQGRPAQLEIRRVFKHFGGVQALGGVDLAVARGDILSVIGPNGAGRTTSYRDVKHYRRRKRWLS